MSSPFGSRNAMPQIPLAMIPTIAGDPKGATPAALGARGVAAAPPLPDLPPAPALEDFAPPTPAPVAAPELPALPELPTLAAPQSPLPALPTLSPAVPMPSMGSRPTQVAARRTRETIVAREGRASTVLTTPAMRTPRRAPRPTLAGAASPYARVTRG